MKKCLMFFLLAATVCLSSCSNERNEVEMAASEMTLRINPSIGVMTRAAKSAWAANDRLGLFVTSGTVGSPYEGISTNLNSPFTYDGKGWTSSRIALTNNPATIFAYYPYEAAVTDATKMRIETLSQTDYLYGAGESTATYLKQNVDIPMKHALSKVVFRMKKGDYTRGPGNLTKVVISNENGGTALQGGGTLNVATGVVTPSSPGKLELTTSQTILTTESSFSAIVMPLTSLAGSNILKVTFTIDGEELYHYFKTGTIWEQGYRNIYSFTLEDNGLEIGGGQDGKGGAITIEPWTDDDESNVILIPVV